MHFVCVCACVCVCVCVCVFPDTVVGGSVSAFAFAWFQMPSQLCSTEAEPSLGCYCEVSPLTPAGCALEAAGGQCWGSGPAQVRC